MRSLSELHYPAPPACHCSCSSSPEHVIKMQCDKIHKKYLSLYIPKHLDVRAVALNGVGVVMVVIVCVGENVI